MLTLPQPHGNPTCNNMPSPSMQGKKDDLNIAATAAFKVAYVDVYTTCQTLIASGKIVEPLHVRKTCSISQQTNVLSLL